MIAGIYHGSEPLCSSQSTQDKIQVEQDNVKIWSWNEHLEFDIETRDVPQGSRLCAVIYEVIEEKGRLLRKKKEVLCVSVYAVHGKHFGGGRNR